MEIDACLTGTILFNTKRVIAAARLAAFLRAKPALSYREMSKGKSVECPR
jgi:hypothetical protein